MPVEDKPEVFELTRKGGEADVNKHYVGCINLLSFFSYPPGLAIVTSINVRPLTQGWWLEEWTIDRVDMKKEACYTQHTFPQELRRTVEEIHYEMDKTIRKATDGDELRKSDN